MEFIREKLGRKKKVRLPQSLAVQAPASPRRRQAAAYREPEAMQMRMEETGFGDLPAAAETPDAESTET